MDTAFLSPDQTRTLHLHAGMALQCVTGRLWLTLECPALRGASPDIVLDAGQHFCMPSCGRAFVHAVAPGTARYVLTPAPAEGCAPARAAPSGWSPLARASAWIQSATRRTSSRGAASACNSQ